MYMKESLVSKQDISSISFVLPCYSQYVEDQPFPSLENDNRMYHFSPPIETVAYL